MAKIPGTENAMNLDKIDNGTVRDMFDSLNENFTTIGKPQAIDTVSIKNGAVTTNKINDGAITRDKLSTELQDYLLNLTHPVHSLYWSLDPTMTEEEANDSTSSKHPSRLFGGTWERIKDRFILAAGDKFIKDYQPVYGGDNEGDLYPVSFSSFRVGDENMDGGVFSFSSKGGHISRQKDWSPTFAYHYNNKTYVSISLAWYRLYENQQSNKIELIGLRDNGVTWETLGLSSNLYIYMSDGSVYTITPNMLSSGNLYPDQTTNNYGGEEAVYLSISEMPTHAHELVSNINYPERAVNTGGDWGLSPVHRVGYGNGNYTNTTGGSQSHNNMPPYEIAYCWMRTA